MSNGKKFTDPINFVMPAGLLWPQVENLSFMQMEQEDLAQKAITGFDNWITLPYIYFKSRGLEVEWSFKPRAGFVNIASGLDLGIAARTIKSFVVVCRIDGHLPEIGNAVIEQNACILSNRNHFFLPHPPQPGLIPRKVGRNSLERIAFKGSLNNIDEQFYNSAFIEKLASIGVEMVLDDYKNLPKGTHHKLHDFSDIDAVLAVRNLTTEDVKVKPANKLVNSWRAGVPALLGPEPAYQELRKTPWDYIEVKNTEEVIHALTRLKFDSDYFNLFVRNGTERAQEFSECKLYDRWFHLFNGPISEQFHKWQQQTLLPKLYFFVSSALREKASRRIAMHNRKNGARILDLPSRGT